MQRIQNLNSYQKGILIVMLILSLVFGAVYLKTIARVGFEYNDAILVPTQEQDSTLYSGKIQGKPACFTVSGQTVIFQYGDRTYGPYTLKEDPSAVPKDEQWHESMTGIEVWEADAVLFRGGILDLGDFYWLYSEDGTSDSMIGISYVTSDGIERDENGNPIDRMRPSVSDLYDLTHNPKLTHMGEALAWFGAVFICILNAVSILFADELFRFNLAFQIRDVTYAEPSDWEIMGRYIGWTFLTIMALVLFVMGLQ